MPNVFGGMRSHTDMTRKFAAGFAVLMASLLALAAGALIAIAYQKNLAQVEHDQEAVARSFQSITKSLRTTVVDYAFWNDAYEHVGRDQVDADWAYGRDNMGESLFSSFSIEGAFIVDRAGQTRYSVINGELGSVTATQFLSTDLGPLVAAARQQAASGQAAFGYYPVDGTVALAYAAAIKPDDMTDEASFANTSVMLFVDVLDIEALGRTTEITDLQAATRPDDGAPYVTLDSAFGSPFFLTWTPARPGDAFLTALLPLLVLIAIVFALVLWALQRRMLRASALFDAGQEALRVSEQRFRSVAESTSDWIWETDSQGRLTFISERFTVMTGLATREWTGRYLYDLLGLDPHTFLSQATASPQTATARRQIECSYADAQGVSRHCMLSIGVIPQGAKHLGYQGTVTDITEEVEAKRQINHLSYHDALTGLPNRRYLQAYLQTKLDNPQGRIFLLSLDLDRFKPVNDTLGHSIGDEVLFAVAQRLKQCVREDDMVARLGGDEFVLVVDDPLPRADLELLCARICDSIGTAFVSGEHELLLGVSIGVAIAPHDAVHASDLLRYADMALYEAKAAGRNNWQFYAPEMNERIVNRRKIETDLRNALRGCELFLEFQPRYTISQQRVSGAEALLRWRHPVQGLLMPDKFIAIAEETGLIIALSDWVLHSACRAATAWPGELQVSVNLSPVEFQRGDLVGRIRHALEATGLAPGRLELEITETVMIKDSVSALQIMLELKRLGVRLSMDDFGTGYSSLSYLRTYPFDGIKIDRSFIADLQGDAKSTAIAIIESIIGLGRALSMTVTAEGVESASQLNDLAGIHCDEAQGYYLGRPQPLEQFETLITQAAPRPCAAADS